MRRNRTIGDRVRFEKSYLDLVDEAGAGCIGYSVRLPAANVTLGGLLRWPADAGSPACQTRTFRGVWPECDGDRITWRCPALALAGEWRRLSAPIEKVLWSDARRQVRWRVHAPAAEAKLEIGGQRLSGGGYAETLSMDVAPWRLPIETLRWGRFVGEGHYVVWIVWEHAASRQWLWCDGEEHEELQAGNARVVWPGCQLQFSSPRILRRGRLGETVFRRWPALRSLLPPALARVDETKWCAAGTLTTAAGKVVRGWVIHEIVRLG